MPDRLMMFWEVPLKNTVHQSIYISDQANFFTGAVFAELLGTYNIKPRLGAIGKQGSIAVTERVIKTLKYEWLKRVAFIKGTDHLIRLCREFEICIIAGGHT